ncbi:MAG: hypothetical protein DME42_00435, partial [Verrucomicrobia bacterium]
MNDAKLPSFPLLDPPPDEIRRMANAAVELMAKYLGTLRDRRLYPDTSSREIREQLDASLPEKATDFEQLLEVIRKPLLEFSRHNGHPRMFG